MHYRFFFATHRADAAQGAPQALAPGPRAEEAAAQGILAAANATSFARRSEAGGLLRLCGLGPQRGPRPQRPVLPLRRLRLQLEDPRALRRQLLQQSQGGELDVG